jgi:hypothetical protein
MTDEVSFSQIVIAVSSAIGELKRSYDVSEFDEDAERNMNTVRKAFCKASDKLRDAWDTILDEKYSRMRQSDELRSKARAKMRSVKSYHEWVMDNIPSFTKETYGYYHHSRPQKKAD